TDLGKDFWAKIYKKAYEQFGTTNIPVNTFNKVWIIPEKAVVYENGDKAFIVESKLKVMLEQDYLALQKNVESLPLGLKSVPHETSDPSQSKLASDIVRAIVIPELEKEVNAGANFAPLRQIYNSLVLAAWFKQTLKNSIINKKYSDQRKVQGVEIADKDVNQKIYQQYLAAYKKGVCDIMKVEYDQYAHKAIPRKYFSGGIELKTSLEGASSIIENINNLPSKGLPAETDLRLASLELENTVQSSGLAGDQAVPTIISSPIENKKGASSNSKSFSRRSGRSKGHMHIEISPEKQRISEQRAEGAFLHILQEIPASIEEALSRLEINATAAQLVGSLKAKYLYGSGVFKDVYRFELNSNIQKKVIVKLNRNTGIPLYQEGELELHKLIGETGEASKIGGVFYAETRQDGSYGQVFLSPPSGVEYITLSVEEFVPGKTIGQMRDKKTKYLENVMRQEAIKTLVNILLSANPGKISKLIGPSDFHQNNVVYNEEKKKAVLVDFGEAMEYDTISDYLMVVLFYFGSRRGDELKVFYDEGLINERPDINWERILVLLRDRVLNLREEFKEFSGSDQQIIYAGQKFAWKDLNRIAKTITVFLANKEEKKASSIDEKPGSSASPLGKVLSGEMDESNHTNYRGANDYNYVFNYMRKGVGTIQHFLNNVIAKKGVTFAADFGHGHGVALQQLKEIFGEQIKTWGIDLNQKRESDMGPIAKKTFVEKYGEEGIKKYLSDSKSFSYIQGDVLDAKIVDASGNPVLMDLITCLYVLQYTEDPLKGWLNMFHQLSDDGMLISQFLFYDNQEGRNNLKFYSMIFDKLKEAGVDIEYEPVTVVRDERRTGETVLYVSAVRTSGQVITLPVEALPFNKKEDTVTVYIEKGSEVYFYDFKQVSYRITGAGVLSVDSRIPSQEIQPKSPEVSSSIYFDIPIELRNLAKEAMRQFSPDLPNGCFLARNWLVETLENERALRSNYFFIDPSAEIALKNGGHRSHVFVQVSDGGRTWVIDGQLKQFEKDLSLDSEFISQGVYEQKEYYEKVLKRTVSSSSLHSEVGGIDFNPAKLKIESAIGSQAVEFDIHPADLEDMDIQGLYPVIINVTPVMNLPFLLGASQEEAGLELSKL
ncbi:MAG: class I SAM-dependent methyltransferase, partial [Candidatus Omnitrophota bacterium]